ncbi:histidine kinase [Leucobacter sp. wl10]|nr:histidine kinase [Leucobacter sp. wl10]
MRLAVLLLPSLIVLVSVGLTASIAAAVQERSVRTATGERVQDVARTLAGLSQVRGALQRAEAEGSSAGRERATSELQPLADVIERASGVEFVVITDAAGIRITHPTAAERGEPVSTDNSAVLAGEEFLGTETGTLGSTLRAKVPVRDGADRVIGTLSVGILEARIAADRDEALRQLLPWALGALVLGTLASSLLAAALERRFRRLDGAAREHERLRRTATALREQSHEFSTRLHVIHGLVSHGDTREALAYIDGVTPVLTGSHDESLSGQPLLRATIEALRAELGALGARLETEIDVVDEVDEEVLLVAANLCRNGGEAGATLVRFALAQSGDRLRGSVDDDGPGIDPREAERIFAVGYTSKPDPTGTGRGLGLDLVRRAVAARHGTIELGGSERGGARFAFEMAVRR